MFDSWIYSVTVNLNKTAFTFEAWNPAPCCLGSGHSILAAELTVSCSRSGENWAHLHQHQGTTHTEGFRICTTGEWNSPSKINLRAVGDHQCAPAVSRCHGVEGFQLHACEKKWINFSVCISFIIIWTCLINLFIMHSLDLFFYIKLAVPGFDHFSFMYICSHTYIVLELYVNFYLRFSRFLCVFICNQTFPFLLLKDLFLCRYWYLCGYKPHMCRDLKRVSDPLGLDCRHLRAAWHGWCAQNWVLWKSKCFWPLSHLSSPSMFSQSLGLHHHISDSVLQFHWGRSYPHSCIHRECFPHSG